MLSKFEGQRRLTEFFSAGKECLAGKIHAAGHCTDAETKVMIGSYQLEENLRKSRSGRSKKSWKCLAFAQ